jgi:hypothetical protein
MNEKSLSHNNVQNQSWNDNPFDLKVAFAGVAKMSPNRRLQLYAEGLVPQYATFDGQQFELFLSYLPEEDQNELVRLLLEATGRDFTECVNGEDFSIDNDYSCAVLAMFKNDCADTRDALADIIRKNIIAYHRQYLDDLLLSACDTHLHQVNNENGLYAHVDREHGDLVWGRF